MQKTKQDLEKEIEMKDQEIKSQQEEIQRQSDSLELRIRELILQQRTIDLLNQNIESLRFKIQKVNEDEMLKEDRQKNPMYVVSDFLASISNKGLKEQGFIIEQVNSYFSIGLNEKMNNLKNNLGYVSNVNDSLQMTGNKIANNQFFLEK